jgi:GT2 family glycosyltransferase
MDLSVIIVNYNVRHFLEQCIISVQNAIQHLNVEILVVDNNSVDDSVAYLKSCKAPVSCIFNTENVGFSKANNQAIKIAQGTYILLLNPDTIVAEDTLVKTLAYMYQHPEAGALGIKMLDSNGRYLPESKRGLPTPAVAFYKLFGLSACFPKSKRFGQYHLSYLRADQNQIVDVLSGAFMLIQKSVINKIGGLDERFFMYGEDVDLSYRITQAGYQNHYFAESSIIHHKGESTKKGNLNYVRLFYGAMAQFAEKHLPETTSWIFVRLIHFAIWLRAGASFIYTLFRSALVPLADFSIILIGLYSCKAAYEVGFKLYPNFYSATMLRLFFPLYSLLWVSAMFLSGAYDKPQRTQPAFRGLLHGTVFILIIYSLLPEYFRFSRALILLGSGFAFMYLVLSRFLFRLLFYRSERLGAILILAQPAEGKRIESLLKSTSRPPESIFYVAPEGGNDFINRLSDLDERIRIHCISELIFSVPAFSTGDILSCMAYFSKHGLKYRIVTAQSDAIIGGQDPNIKSELFTFSLNDFGQPINRRKKRLLELVLVFTILLLSPLLIGFMSSPLHFFKNSYAVIRGRRHLVGLASKHPQQPIINLSQIGHVPHEVLSDYMHHYRWEKDLVYCFKYITKLGNKC